MDEFIKILDKNLEYRSHEITNDMIYIHVFSIRSKVLCPFCGMESSKVHSTYDRRFQDIPIQGKKVQFLLNNRKMFCRNQNCNHTTFAETFKCLPYKAKKTIRLTKAILDISLNVSSLTASAILTNGTRERRLLQQMQQETSRECEVIERRHFIKLRYKPLDEKAKITEKQVKSLLNKYPHVAQVYYRVKAFKDVLFSGKKEELEKWIEEAVSLKIGEISSFANGVLRDKEAVKNAIAYQYSNGLAEGSVNKLKVIKRIMYGRNSFSLLRNKILALEIKR